MREVSLLPSSLRLDFLLSACGGFSGCSSDSNGRSAPSPLFGLVLFGGGAKGGGFTTDTRLQSHKHREHQGARGVHFMHVRGVTYVPPFGHT